MRTEMQHYPANTEFSKLDPRITKSYSACSSLFISQRIMRFFRFDETPSKTESNLSILLALLCVFEWMNSLFWKLQHLKVDSSPSASISDYGVFLESKR